jgi:hypothetical protein
VLPLLEQSFARSWQIARVRGSSDPAFAVDFDTAAGMGNKEIRRDLPTDCELVHRRWLATIRPKRETIDPKRVLAGRGFLNI